MVLGEWVSIPTTQYECLPSAYKRERTNRPSTKLGQRARWEGMDPNPSIESSREIAKGHCEHKMATADKRIPLTEEQWRELNGLKGPGQTYDDLIKELVEQYKKMQLMHHIDQLREDQEEFVPLEEV